MNIERILPEYRGESTGAPAKLAERVREGELSPQQSPAAQARLYGTYLAAGVRRVAERMA
ncbi:MAG: hypothetical protein JO284_18315 [Planctomycetaceae bacterium]|nr:hypothetical protein [Planctomycetaceae bacterium]